MTELNTQLSIDDLMALSEPVRMADLRDGSALEVLRVAKDVDAIQHFIAGLKGSDDQTDEALVLVRTQCLALGEKIAEIKFSGFKVECGETIAEHYNRMLYTLEFLIDLIDSAAIPKIESAFVTS